MSHDSHIGYGGTSHWHTWKQQGCPMTASQAMKGHPTDTSGSNRNALQQLQLLSFTVASHMPQHPERAQVIIANLIHISRKRKVSEPEIEEKENQSPFTPVLEELVKPKIN
ncbi:hypothetical protein BKA83DRAFT_4128939 [Pisolithus microcarpus]|nr:hypothetical protein BKA83DRAFT_4128939 [Pisolithus microcarpus]